MRWDYLFRTTLEDVQDICSYLITKPTGASVNDAKAVLDAKRLDPRKVNAYKFWGFVDGDKSRLKITEIGRQFIKNEESKNEAILQIIKNIEPYCAIIERVTHRHEDSITSIDVASHWFEHFSSQVSENEKILKDQSVCFFQLASGSLLGSMIVGRKGQPTRFSFNNEGLVKFVSQISNIPEDTSEKTIITNENEEQENDTKSPDIDTKKYELGKGIFIAHGKNKKPLDQLKNILTEFKIPYKIAVEEPNLGRPISKKVRDIMESCNCAILIFTADEEFKDKDGNTIWRPSENVIYELGASGYLYDNRIVIMKEEEVNFPTNFKDIGYISFEKDKLKEKTMDILKEFIGFGIVTIST